MKYKVYDCLANTEISIEATKEKADEICAIHGGADACIHVFEIDKTVKERDKKEQKPEKGMLF